MLLSRTFLYKLSKKNKLLFFVSIVYLFICIITILKSFQITPFYNWSMYSGAVAPPKTYGFTEIYCDSVLLHQPHTYNDFSRIMIIYTTNEYLRLIDSNNVRSTYDRVNRTLNNLGLDGQYVANKLSVSESLVSQYPAWLKRYVKKNLVPNFDSISLYKLTVRYDSVANLRLVDRQLIFTQ